MKIAILGCGWLGLPLAEHLIDQGFQVNGSTTSEEKLALLQQKGIQSFLIEVTEEKITGDFEGFLEQVEILIIDIPPGLRKNPNGNFTKKIDQILQKMEERSLKVIFVSSTSVYGDHQGEVDETIPAEPETTSGKQLLASEQLLQQSENLQVTVIRFAGLFDENRHPVKFLSGRENVKQKYHFVHLIHKCDCIGIITSIIEKDKFPFLLNAVYPYNPNRGNYYTEKALQQNLPVPIFQEESPGKKGKHIISINISYLNYSFQKDLFS
ncbi:NAD(P)H-binding [Pustulibacterium marinum]|uniref:NAD(P)H-binding n=1 Tax=Pustulibacterium marinum TaxID=1224947 RepID=A0A1I7EZS1_9FLAO|nr:NAD(P)H-binding protein [Pustulibacterium marinum]SFU29438.1 NAD(P)H-binding [Pustulibacterium marinum]